MRGLPDSTRRRRHRLRLGLGTLGGAAAVTAALAALFGAEPPGAGIRGDLDAGSAALAALPQTASDAAVRAVMREAFRGRAISVDAAHYPVEVAVTLRGVDRRNCRAAAASAQRIEGTVVVELEGFRSPSACGSENDMTWRFLP